MRVTSFGLMAVLLAATACHTMQPLTMEELNTLRPQHAWVTDENSSTFMISGPQVFGDTVVGYVEGRFRELPGSDLKQVAIRRPDRKKTIMLAVASTAAAVGVGVIISGTGLFGRTPGTDCNDVPDAPECQGMGMP
jgi:hypothetical protein